MNKTVLAASPVTQAAAAVKQLITYHNHGTAPAEMPPFYRLSADMVLVQSKKGDAYYVTTPRSCSCPAAAYNPGQLCKHSRKYFPESMRQAAARQPEEPVDAPRRLARPPDETGSIRPKMGSFKPFSLLPSEEKAAAGVV